MINNFKYGVPNKNRCRCSRNVGHDFRLIQVHLETYLLRNSVEVSEHLAQVFQRFCHDHDIVCKSKVSDILAIDVDAMSFPSQKLEHIFQSSGEPLRRYDISLSDTPLQLDGT